MKNTRTTPLALAGAFVFLLLSAPAAAQSELLKLEAVASYYGAEFHGKPTSSGEIFDMNDLTAAHKTLAFGTILEVTNLESGKKVTVRVNDRGPFVADRELDVSKAAAEMLGMITTGTARVSIRRLSGPTAGPQAAAPQAAAPAGQNAAAVSPQTAAPVTAAAAPQPPASQTAPTGTATTAAVPTTARPAAETPSGTGWRIQLGSFSKEDNATRLVIRLRKDGFNPSFEKTETLIRVVLTGISPQELEGMRNKLETAGYTGFLVRQESW